MVILNLGIFSSHSYPFTEDPNLPRVVCTVFGFTPISNAEFEICVHMKPKGAVPHCADWH